MGNIKVRLLVGVFAIMIAEVLSCNRVSACWNPPPPACPPCHSWDPEGCINWCECPCMGCVPGEGCYEDCDVEHGFYCCCSADNSEGACCDVNNCETCDNGDCVDRCDPDLCEECDGEGHCRICGGRPYEACCDGDCVDYYKVNGNVGMTGSVSVTAPGLSWSWTKEWSGYGGINASLGITITPSITVDSASVWAHGVDSDCGSCLTLSGGGSGTGQITCTAGGQITLYSQTGWEWFDEHCNLNINVSAEAEASVSAFANGMYNKGPDCDFTGFCLTGYGAEPVTVAGTITFRMLGIDFSATSGLVPIIEGCSVYPEC